jgi:hypothetical protein
LAIFGAACFIAIAGIIALNRLKFHDLGTGQTLAMLTLQVLTILCFCVGYVSFISTIAAFIAPPSHVGNGYGGLYVLFTAPAVIVSLALCGLFWLISKLTLKRGLFGKKTLVGGGIFLAILTVILLTH